jgi:hypothetical protein
MPEKLNPFVSALARALWDRDAKAKQSESTREERLAAWKQDRHDYIKAARQIEGRLTKRGFTVTAPADATGDDE